MNLDAIKNAFKSQYESMADYINKKYRSDHFTFVREFGSKIGSPVTKIYVRSEKFPDRPVCVMCDEDEEGNDVFNDNYMAVKYYDKTVNTILDILKGLYGDKFFLCCGTSIYAFTEGANDNMSFEEFAAENSSLIDFTAIVEYDISKEGKAHTEEALKEALCAKGIACSGKIYYASDDFDVSTLTYENFYYAYLANKTYDASLFFSLDLEKGYLINDWQVADNA